MWRVGAEEVGFTGDGLRLRVGDGEKGYTGGIRVGARQVTHVVRYQLLRLLLCPFMSFLRPIEASLIYSGADTLTSAQYVADTSQTHTHHFTQACHRFHFRTADAYFFSRSSNSSRTTGTVMAAHSIHLFMSRHFAHTLPSAQISCRTILFFHV